MKSRKLIGICFLLILALLFSGCKKNGNETAQASSAGRYDWASSAAEEETSLDPFGGNTSASMQLLSINDEAIDPLNLTTEFDGTPLKLNCAFSYTGDRPVNTTVFLTIDGVIQPFRLEEESEERTVYQFEAKEKTAIRPVFYIDHPVLLSTDEYSSIGIHFLYNYDYQLNEPSSNHVMSGSVFAFFSVKAAKKDLETNNQLDSVPLDQLEYREEEVPYSEELQMNFPHYGIFRNELPLVSGMNGYEFEYYIEGKPEDRFYLALSQEEGNYRTVILQDGQPIPAFHGKTYLDWHSSGKAQGIQVNLDPSAFASGSHNYYAVTVCTDVSESGEPHIPQRGSMDFYSFPTTIVME